MNLGHDPICRREAQKTEAFTLMQYKHVVVAEIVQSKIRAKACGLMATRATTPCLLLELLSHQINGGE